MLTQFGLWHASSARGAAISIPATALLLWMLAPLLLDLRQWDGRAALIFFAVGIPFPAAVTMLTFAANRRMGPSVAGALGNLAPLFAVLVAAAALGDVPHALQGLGIAMTILGVVTLSLDRRWLDTEWPFWTIALPLTAAAIRGLIQPAIKVGLSMWPSPFAAALVGYTVSTVVVVSAAHFRNDRAPLPHAGVIWFAGVGICNGLGVLLMYAALARGDVTYVAPLVGIYPLIALFLSAALWQGAALTPTRLAGIVTAVAGAALLIGGRP